MSKQKMAESEPEPPSPPKTLSVGGHPSKKPSKEDAEAVSNQHVVKEAKSISEQVEEAIEEWIKERKKRK